MTSHYACKEATKTERRPVQHRHGLQKHQLARWAARSRTIEFSRVTEISTAQNVGDGLELDSERARETEHAKKNESRSRDKRVVQLSEHTGRRQPRDPRTLSIVDEESQVYVGSWVSRSATRIIRQIDPSRRIISIRYVNPESEMERYRKFFYEGPDLSRVLTYTYPRSDALEVGDDNSVSITEMSPSSELYREIVEGEEIWLIETDGIRAILPGSIHLFTDGAFHVETEVEGHCTIEYPDGSRVVEACTEGCRAHKTIRKNSENNSISTTTESVRNESADRPSRISAPHSIASKSDGEGKLLGILSSVSHDLRSPLTSIQGLLTLLSAGAFGELPDKAAERIKTVELDLSRLIRLTNELLDADQLVTGKLNLRTAPCRVQEIFTTAISSLSGLAAQRSIRLIFSATDLLVLADRDRILRVVVNLITNAIKYSPQESIVSLSAESSDGDVVIRVKDSGIGIPERFQASIFERFQQGPDSGTKREGYGLGLAISKSIIEAHGGAIGVASRPGYGSTFWIKLPGERSHRAPSVARLSRDH